VNLWQKYTFTRGALQGFYVGGGVNSLGKTYVHHEVMGGLFPFEVAVFVETFEVKHTTSTDTVIHRSTGLNLRNEFVVGFCLILKHF
jgi:hypothetical protein